MTIQLLVGKSVRHNRIFLRECARGSYMLTMAWLLGLRVAGQHGCCARQHPVCAVQALWGGEGDGGHDVRLSGLRGSAVLTAAVAGAPCRWAKARAAADRGAGEVARGPLRMRR